METRDVIVIGASLGGVEALGSLVAQLPAGLPAAVLVVQHSAEDSPGALAEMLERRGPLPAVLAADGEALRPGSIYVAPPNRHLLLSPAGLRVVYGPRENRVRPAIDPLFRTAAVHYRSRVIGVVLTGLLDDGAAGLLAVARCGGVAVVQEPADAEHPEMPASALEVVPAARQARLAELGTLLTRVAGEPAPPPPPVPELLAMEVRLTERAMGNDDWRQLPGRPSEFSCPECGGNLRELADDGVRRYRCRVGHAYTSHTMGKANEAAVEEALWIALRALEEREQLLLRLARDDDERGRKTSASSFAQRATEVRIQGDKLRAVLASLSE